MAQLPLADHLRTLPHGIVFAAVHFTDGDGHPLLLKSVYDPDVWQFAGGNLEFGSDPWDSARREVREETGLLLPTQPAPPLLALLFVAAAGEWPFKVGVVFDGGTLTAEQLAGLALDPAEHTEFAVRPLSEWRTVLTPPRLALVEAVARARDTGRAAYLHLPPQRTGD
ncbi:NUDIX hydrolase [Kitasatospora acidiphila]|uniref:NUDIX hydrolase n=1 Tax=Kitasatospora acidiphila TaxID=2567942 RepID=A0A540VY36_9ACTN|nr:NUDIX hydrolase [Kitasatospora acidiphila]TQF01678.1 NUDIX hydrolase [Kitasatospora acidiphila]